MSSDFWIGVLLGGFVSLITGFVANFYTPPLREFISAKKLSFVERSKKRAFTEYLTLVEMKDAQSDKVLFFIHLYCISIVMFVMGFMFLILTVVLQWKYEHTYNIGTDLLIDVSTVFAMASLIAGGIRLLQGGLARSRLEDFSRYEASLKDRWGELPTQRLPNPIGSAPAATKTAP
ncbi:MAG TPA: hypothetical protein VII40_02700 [Xanthobacteraceae bacterium]